MKLRIAVIGAGGVAARHVRILSGFDDAEVVAVADPVAAAARRLAAAVPGATAYADADQALDAARPDAVYVCVPPFAHGAPERAALARGLPLFVEKPLAVDLATAEELADEIDAAGVPTGTGYHWRCLDTVARAREVLERSPARLVQGRWLDKVPPPAWWATRELSGGQVVEQLTHVLDLARVLVGEVAGGSAVASRADSSPGDVDDVTAATLTFRSGAVGTLAASSLLAGKHAADLRTVSADGTVLTISETELRIGAETVRPTVDGHTVVDREFLDTVLGRREATRAPYREALATHRLGTALARSAATGTAVRL